MNDQQLRPLSATRQVAFHQLLVGARKTLLIDALSEAVQKIDPNLLKEQIAEYVPPDAQRLLAGAGIRDEQVFPTPVVLETAPTLVGYYRLLLGVPQKSFYATGSGMGRYKSMETKGTLNERQRLGLDEFCHVMCLALAELVQQISPTVTQRDVNELPLLTLGSQLQGGNNNLIGKQATLDVFLSMIEAVDAYIVKREPNKLTVENSEGKMFNIRFASDPDVTIEEITEDQISPKVALEIKGGTDRSNAHNRAGEAEKSHLKAKKNLGYPLSWTVIHTKGLVTDVLQNESPSTDQWFDIAQVIGREGQDWLEFKKAISQIIGFPST